MRDRDRGGTPSLVWAIQQSTVLVRTFLAHQYSLRFERMLAKKLRNPKYRQHMAETTSLENMWQRLHVVERDCFEIR